MNKIQKFVYEVISDKEINLKNTNEIEFCKEDVDEILQKNFVYEKSIFWIEVDDNKCIVWFDDSSNVSIDASWFKKILNIHQRIISSRYREYITENDFIGIETSDKKYVFIVEILEE